MVQVVSITLRKRRVIEIAQRLPLLPSDRETPGAEHLVSIEDTVFWKGSPEALLPV